MGLTLAPGRPALSMQPGACFSPKRGAHPWATGPWRCSKICLGQARAAAWGPGAPCPWTLHSASITRLALIAATPNRRTGQQVQWGKPRLRETCQAGGTWQPEGNSGLSCPVAGPGKDRAEAVCRGLQTARPLGTGGGKTGCRKGRQETLEDAGQGPGPRAALEGRQEERLS